MKRFFKFMVIGIVSISFFTACSSRDKSVRVTSENPIENSDVNQGEDIIKVEDELESTEKSQVENKSSEKNINSNQNQGTVNDGVAKKVVVIDPGHASSSNHEKEKVSPDSEVMKIKDGGGAEGVVTKTPEYKIAMSVSLKLKEMLEQNGVEVIMTKTSNEVSLGNIERAEVGNSNNADIEIRIHCDSAENQNAKGASMLVPAKCGYAASISDTSRVYGEKILKNVVSTVGMNNRGVIERKDLTGFNWSKVPVVLIEMGFLSNPEEDKLLNDDNYQNKLAQGMCNGILESLQS